MNNKINYEDSIFFLALMLKNLTAGLKLNIDTRIFQNKILEDLFFIERSIKYFYNSLLQSSLKIKKNEYLKSIQKIIKMYISLIESILSRKLPMANSLTNNFRHFQNIREEYLKNVNEIKGRLKKQSKLNDDESYIISNEEFKLLLEEEKEE